MYGWVVVAYARLVAFVWDNKELVHCDLLSASPSSFRLQRLGITSVHGYMSWTQGAETYLVLMSDG